VLVFYYCWLDIGSSGVHGDVTLTRLGASTINGSDVNVAATFPGPFDRPQGSVGSDFVNNQLGMTSHYGIGNSQGSDGVAPYILLSGGLEGSPAYVRGMSNRSGWEEALTGPLVADRAGEGVHVSLSLFPSVPYSDRRASIENAQSPIPV
jgi:hypothetical protein